MRIERLSPRIVGRGRGALSAVVTRVTTCANYFCCCCAMGGTVVSVTEGHGQVNPMAARQLPIDRNQNSEPETVFVSTRIRKKEEIVYQPF